MGTAAQLSQSEIDALRAKLMALWNPPVGMQEANNTQVTIRIRFKRDGTLAAGPQVLTSGTGTSSTTMRDSAVRACSSASPTPCCAPIITTCGRKSIYLRHATDVQRPSKVTPSRD